MKTSLFQFPHKDQTYADIIDLAADVGFDAVELYCAAELSRPDTEAAKRLAQRAAHRGLPISCLSVGINLAAPDNREETERLMRYVDVAAAAGCLYLHHTLAPTLSHLYEPVTFAALLARVLPAARAVCDYAAGRGVTCLYEDQGFHFNGSERFGAFFDALERNNTGVVADLGNSLFVAEPPERFTGRFAHLVRHVHVKDYELRTERPNETGWMMTRDGAFLRDVLYGDGVIDFARVFRILHAAGYEGYCSLELGGALAEEQPLRAALWRMKEEISRCG